MRTVYRLRDNDVLSKGYYEASADPDGPYGLKITHGIPAGEEWWANIESGVLPLITRKGIITRTYYGGMMFSDPMFDMLTDTGEMFKYLCYVNNEFDGYEYCRGRRIEVDVVRQTRKSREPGVALETDVEIEVRIDDSKPIPLYKRILRMGNKFIRGLEVRLRKNASNANKP